MASRIAMPWPSSPEREVKRFQLLTFGYGLETFPRSLTRSLKPVFLTNAQISSWYLLSAAGPINSSRDCGYRLWNPRNALTSSIWLFLGSIPPRKPTRNMDDVELRPDWLRISLRFRPHGRDRVREGSTPPSIRMRR